MTKREAAVGTLCREIAEYISENVTEGIGTWPRAWTIVEEASTAFNAACRRWIRHGHVGGFQGAEQAGIPLVEAWQQADEAYRSRGGDGR